MKKNLLTVTTLILLVISTSAFAQEDDITFKFGIKAGWGFFLGEPLDETVENNWIVGGDLTMWLPSGLGFGVDAKYSTKDQDAADIDDFNVDFEFTTAPINLNAYYKMMNPDNEFTPYFGGGFSMVYADITATDYDRAGLEVTADDWSMGFNVIAGIEYGNFFVEGQYIWAQSEFEELNFLKEDIEDDLNVGGFNVMAGVRF